MPTPFMHLALAEDILHDDHLSPAARSLLRRQRGPFLLGNTAPDVQTVSKQERIETHFYTLPRTSERPAHESLFAAHPILSRPDALAPTHAAFIAGYIVHLQLDELWLDSVYLRYFWERDSKQERAFLHNILRAWLDAHDRQRINGTSRAALQATEPRGWLPFTNDAELRAWRDWLVEQLTPGQSAQTTEVFARRVGVSAAEMEAVLASPEQMETRIFCRVPQAVLQSFHDTGLAESVRLLQWYLLNKAGKMGGVRAA